MSRETTSSLTNEVHKAIQTSRYSVTEIAEASGVPRRTIYRLLRRQHATQIWAVERLAEVLGVRVVRPKIVPLAERYAVRRKTVKIRSES